MSEAGYTYLKNLNPHPLDNKIRFEDFGHLYYIDGKLCRKEDGWLSTTTFLHDFWEAFDAANIIHKMMKKELKKTKKCAGMSDRELGEAAQKAIDNGDKFVLNEKYSGMSAQEMKESWEKNGQKSCILGSKMHDKICERYYNKLPINMEEIADVAKEYELFLEFAKDHEHLEPFRAEFMIFDTRVKITGSLDMLFRDPDGEHLHIYDWKRLNKPMEKTTKFKKYSTHPLLSHLPDCNFYHYALQQNIYKFILEKNYGFKVKSMVLVAMHSSMDKYETHEVPDLQKEISLLFEERYRKLNNIPEPSEDITDTIDLSKCIL